MRTLLPRMLIDTVEPAQESPELRLQRASPLDTHSGAMFLLRT